MAAVGLMLLGISSVIALTGGFGSRSAPAVIPATPIAKTALAPEKQDTSLSTAASPEVKVEPETLRKETVAVPVAAPIRKSVAPPAETERTAPATATNQKPVVTTEPKIPPASESTSKADSVRVVLRIENGRVAEASIANHKPGMDAVEALALRIARQRRYPGKTSGPETVVIKVTPSN